jgi:tetratricopeptide (TPR) repeat protein
MADDPPKPDAHAKTQLGETIVDDPPSGGNPRPSATEATVVAVDPTWHADRDSGAGDLALPTIERGVYAIGAYVAKGGMGRIRVAYDRRAGRPVALKELLTDNATARLRFEREAKITARLQHPAIVPIYEVGRWEDGEPFYAMKHVDGRSLDRVIADATTLRERLALVPNVLAVADALAYAHSCGIIHRDLKPANILVGPFGETVVIDWGLAKELSATELPSDLAPRDSDGGLTVAGSTLGTPVYMPPEQARGEPVDTRADVYAIGATLYHALSGAVPYRDAKSGMDVLARIDTGPPQPLRDLVPDLPADLVAVVEQAMARAASDRYPSAKELADDLRRFQTGQLVGVHRYSLRQLLRRSLERHRTAVTVAVIAAAVLAIGGGLALEGIVRAERHAQVQRVDAQRSRQDAEDLMSFMLVDLRDKLQAVGRLELLDVAAKKAVAYYDRRLDDLNNAELAKRALARANLADVLLAQGHTDAALHEYQASLAMRETLAIADPANAERRSAVALGHGQLGDVWLAQGHAGEALREYQAYFAIENALVADDGSNPSRQGDLADAHRKLGEVLDRQGDTAGALAEYRALLAIAERLATNNPNEPARERLWMVGQINVAEVLLARGDSASALEQYRSALGTAARLAARDPKNADYQRDVLLGHQRVGDVLLTTGNVADALAEYRAFVAIAATSATRDPTNADRQEELALGHAKVGEALLAQSHTAEALVEDRAFLTIAETLATRDPNNANAQRDLSIGHAKIADVLLAQGNTAAALAEYRAFMTIAETIATKDPSNAEAQQYVAAGHAKLGEILARTDPAAALAEDRQFVSMIETLAAKDPNNADRQQDLADGHTSIGALLLERDPRGALRELQAALAIMKSLATNDPSNSERQASLARLHQSIGDALVALGDNTAHAEYEAALAIVKQLQAKDPQSAEWKQLSQSLATKIRAR